MQRDGYLDGFCVFFTVKFDDDNAFSTFPDCKPTHWSTPNFRVERRAVRRGDVLDLRMKFDDIRSMDSWSVEGGALRAVVLRLDRCHASSSECQHPSAIFIDQPKPPHHIFVSPRCRIVWPSMILNKVDLRGHRITVSDFLRIKNLNRFQAAESTSSLGALANHRIPNPPKPLNAGADLVWFVNHSSARISFPGTTFVKNATTRSFSRLSMRPMPMRNGRQIRKSKEQPYIGAD